MKVAVIGATGYVGGRLVPELLAAGHDVRCLARTPERRQVALLQRTLRRAEKLANLGAKYEMRGIAYKLGSK